MYSGITSGGVLNGELLYTKTLEVNLFAFAYRLFHEDFSSIIGDFCIGMSMRCIALYEYQCMSTNIIAKVPDIEEKSS